MLHERLEELRTKKKWSQKETSERLGIARTTYSGYEIGAREPDIKMLTKISTLYDVSIEWLITGREREMPEEIEKMVDDYIELNEEDRQHILYMIDRLKKERP